MILKRGCANPKSGRVPFFFGFRRLNIMYFLSFSVSKRNVGSLSVA